jgi:hypothetical protein
MSMASSPAQWLFLQRNNSFSVLVTAVIWSGLPGQEAG